MDSTPARTRPRIVVIGYGWWGRDCHCRLISLTDDQRPPFALDDVAGVNLSGNDAQRAAVAPTFAMTGVTG